jgi:hypothetical protein
MPAIRQLRGPRNRLAAPAVWQAAYAWLGSQAPRRILAEDRRLKETVRNRRLLDFWRPYLGHVATAPEAPEVRELLLGSSARRAGRRVQAATRVTVQAARGRHGEEPERPVEPASGADALSGSRI